MNETIRLMPDHANAYHNRGAAYYRLRQYARALADFETAIRLNPADTAAVQNRDAARRALGDAEE